MEVHNFNQSLERVEGLGCDLVKVVANGEQGSVEWVDLKLQDLRGMGGHDDVQQLDVLGT